MIVKQLKWEWCESKTLSIAYTPFITYYVSFYAGMSLPYKIWNEGVCPYDPNNSSWNRVETFHDAKTLCQDHFEKNIKACLEGY